MQASEPIPSQRPIERLRATVMFADLAGFNALVEKAGPEEAYAHYTGCLQLLDGAVRRHGGAVDKYLGDALLAVFGYPIRREDAALAAVRAALEMRRHVEEYNRQFRPPLPLGLYIGINTGSMIAGDVRGPVIREFHVLGDAVNTAARIKAKAPVGSIYVGPETWIETRGHVEFEALAPMRMKGKAKPVPVYEVVGAKRGGAAEEDELAKVALAGREAELEPLRSALGRLAAGSGGVVTLSGEEGLGKTRLLRELRAAPDAARFAWIESSAEHTGAGGAEDASAGGAEDAGAGAAPDGLAESLRELLGAAEVDGDASALERRIREITREQPLVWIVDDAHWAGAAALELLERLLPLSAQLPLLVLVAFRPAGGNAARLRQLLESLPAPHVETLSLAPLAPEAAARLVDALLADREAPSGARELILERGAGNPARLAMAVALAAALRSESQHSEELDERSSETERRRSTVLFADITGFTAMSEKMEPEAAYPVVAGCLELLDGIARKHGGTVDKYLGDCVLALFGVPKAIEDAPRAAVNAGIEMLHAVRRYSEERNLEHPLDVHIGVSTGLGIAGDISGPLIREYAVMGDAVVAASELCDLAERGELYVGEETERTTRDFFEYRGGEPLQLKGRSEPLASFELLSRRVQLHRAKVGAGRRVFSPLVGREAELEALEAALERLERGEGGIVTLLAEAGLGKSRLVSELRGKAAERNWAWREGRSLSTGGQLAYHPFADLTREWAQIGDDDDDASARAKLEAAIELVAPGASDEILPFLGPLLGLQPTAAERERLDRIQGDALEKMVRAAVTRMLRGGSRLLPLVVVLDDLHWADQSSIELLEALLRLAEEERVLFLHVARPGFPSTSGRVREHVRAEHAARHVELTLAPLDAGAARRMLKNLFREGDIPPATRQAIEEKAGGNPFYIEEVVRSLVDEGAVEWQDGSFVATERIHQAVIPGSVQEVVMARVDRLPLARRQLLQLASVVGQSFHREVLERVAREPQALAEQLEALIEAEFLTPWDRLGGEEYAFKHPLIQEVTYDGILGARREQLHREVAEAIEAALPEETPGYTAMLAFHFGRGRDADRAEPYLFRAGEEAARGAASSEALAFFREASRLYFERHGEGGDPRKKAELEKHMARALFNRGLLVEAVGHFDAALGHLGHRDPTAGLRANLRFASDLAAVAAKLGRPIHKRKLPPARREDREQLDVLFQRALAETTALPMRFVFDSVTMMRRLSKVDPRTVPEAGGMYAGAVGVFSYSGVSFALGRRILERAREVVEAGGTRDLYLYYRVMNFVHHFLSGDWSEAHEVTPAEIETGIREGRFWDVTTYLNLHGVKKLWQGDFGAAAERIEQLQKLADLYQHDLAASAAQAMTGYLALERGQLDAAFEALELYYDEHPEPLFQLQALSNRAKVEALRGDLVAAERSLERAAAKRAEAGRVIPYQGSSYDVIRFRVDVAKLEAAAREDAPPRALRDATRNSRRAALKSTAKVAGRRAEALRLEGREAFLLGRHKAALEAWRRSLAHAERIAARPEQARTLAEIALRLAPGERFDGEDAASLAARALASLEALGLSSEAERLRGRSQPEVLQERAKPA